jgi:hypothetical protein
MAATIFTTSLFSGIMGVRRASDTAKTARENEMRRARVAVARKSKEPTLTDEMDIADDQDIAAEERSTNWADRTGRKENRIHKILADGPSSGDYRGDVLADRANAAGAANSIN